MGPNTSIHKKNFIFRIGFGYSYQAITVAKGLLLVPLYLHLLGPRMYGFWLASGGVIAWLGILDMGMTQLIIQKTATSFGKRDLQEVCDYFLNGTIIHSLIAAVVILIGIILSGFIPGFLGAKDVETSVLKYAFILASVSAALNMLAGSQAGLAFSFLKPVFPGISRIISEILSTLLTVVFLLKGFGVLAIPTGMLAGGALYFFLNLGYNTYLFSKMKVRFRFQFNYIKPFLHLGPSVSLARLGNVIVNRSEPTIITLFLGPETASIYAVTIKAASMFNMMLHTKISALAPSISHLTGEGNMKEVSQMIRQMLRLGISIAIVGYGVYIAVNHQFVKLWVGEEMFASQYVVIMVSIGLTALFVLDFLYRSLISMGDIIWASTAYFLNAIARLLLMSLLLLKTGIIGLPVSLTISSILFIILYSKRLGRNFKVINLQSFLKFVCELTLVFAASFFISIIFLAIRQHEII